MTRQIRAELLQLHRRTATRVLFGLWLALVVLFDYVLPYAQGGPLAGYLPAAVPSTVIGGFPFFGGVFALMLGVLASGSEYGWDTLKSLVAQEPRRDRLVAAKLGALGLVLAGFTVAALVAAAITSLVIALATGAAVAAPAPGAVAGALGAGWLTLATWAALGVALGALTRGTSLAIGVGIVWALVIEGLLTTVLGNGSALEPITHAFLRVDGYSLSHAVSAAAGIAVADPSGYGGPTVGVAQATVTLGAYIVVLAGVAVLAIRRRDVA